MKRARCSTLIASALAAFLLAPTASDANPNTTTYKLVTSVFERQPGTDEHDGTMQLTVAADGTITGYYRPRNGRFVLVNGGVDAQGSLWLEIGVSAEGVAGRFFGTLKDGKLDATSTKGDLVFELIGTPQK
jgi:hypothetical protein